MTSDVTDRHRPAQDPCSYIYIDIPTVLVSLPEYTESLNRSFYDIELLF